MISLAKTDVGQKRSNNEDFVFASDSQVGSLPNLYIVADGMGGYNGGEVASREAVAAFIDFASKAKENEITDILAGGIKASNEAVLKLSLENPELNQMGTTMDCVVIDNNKAYIAHIGDSRVYIINEEIRRLTNDHSYVMDLVRAGLISQEEADVHPDKNMITRAVGVENNVECDVIFSAVKEGDYILLCSDGLFDMLNDNVISDIVKNEDFSLDDKINMLIGGANRMGGRDNISAVLIRC